MCLAGYCKAGWAVCSQHGSNQGSFRTRSGQADSSPCSVLASPAHRECSCHTLGRPMARSLKPHWRLHPLHRRQRAALQVEVARVYVGTFMTSLDMSGFSLSVCALDDERAAALDADTQVGPDAPRSERHCQLRALWITSQAMTPACAALLCRTVSLLAPSHCRGWLQAPAWPRCQGAHVPDKAPAPLPSHETDEQHTQRPEHLSASGCCMERALAAVCSAVIGAAPELDALDAK